MQEGNESQKRRERKKGGKELERGKEKEREKIYKEGKKDDAEKCFINLINNIDIDYFWLPTGFCDFNGQTFNGSSCFIILSDFKIQICYLSKVEYL